VAVGNDVFIREGWCAYATFQITSVEIDGSYLRYDFAFRSNAHPPFCRDHNPVQNQSKRSEKLDA